MPRRLLINEKPSFASIEHSHQQLSRVPRGTVNRHSQFHCPKSKISKVRILLGTYGKNSRDWHTLMNLVLYFVIPNNFHLWIKCVILRPLSRGERQNPPFGAVATLRGSDGSSHDVHPSGAVPPPTPADSQSGGGRRRGGERASSSSSFFLCYYLQAALER